MGRATGCERVHTLSRSPGAVLAGIWVFDTPPRVTGCERAATLSRSPVGLHWRGFEFPTVRAFRRRIWFPAKRAWGAPLPYTPSGDGVREGATLSRSPVGLFWRGFGFLTVQVFRRRIWLPTKRAWGAPLPYIPSGDGEREGCDPLALSRGAVLAGIWVSDGAGIPVKNLASDEAGVGRSAPLHPLGRRGARGCDPLALSRGAVLAGIWVFTKRWFFF